MTGLRDIYQVYKPGIVYGNTFHGLLGVLLALYMYGLASAGVRIIFFVFGLMLIVASASAANNYLERTYDRAMQRTKKRLFVVNTSIRAWAMVMIGVPLVVGLWLLWAWCGWYVTVLGVLAYVLYVWVYTPLKRKTPVNTLVGAIPGALPGLAGYIVVSGVIDQVAVALFLVLFVWQLPHFYAISAFRKEDYEKAGFKMLSSVRSEASMRRIILMYLGVFMFSCISLAWTLGVWGWGYVLLALFWTFRATITFDLAYDKWARGVFGMSLLVSLLMVGYAGIITALRLV